MISKRDLAEIIGSEITGVGINPASVSMEFGRGYRYSGSGWILIQCGFSLEHSEGEIIGDASSPQSSSSLQRCLNQLVVDANFDEQKVLTLTLESDLIVRIVPDLDGLESYVLHTSQGIVPVIAV
ncbi:hypothetical protein [Paraburkholderia gardini]|uniref:Immunity protein 50 of polymorphic toxin system n=1 Tax=Paraburkholderia gardini TaxID=2823469 RepID=A0ABM8U8X3_9BURK|nr:hypothetical protein [Paraburkholderia gardini]CAG4890630.1 hypothetical protein R69919_00986 [Paraburkholderia gardini]CAG4917471.1 hypothetical protein R54767_04410 [Paraburkholderia gardini]